MNYYEPQQHLSFQQVSPLRDADPKISFPIKTKAFLKSSTSILVKENETVSKFYNEGDPFVIQYKVTKSESYSERHVERHVVYINYTRESPQSHYYVKVEVFGLDGKKVNSVTSTISGDADIRERDDE
jgi:hypothetical protein